MWPSRQGGWREGAERPGLASQPPPGHPWDRDHATDLLGLPNAPAISIPAPPDMQNRSRGGVGEVQIFF